MKKHETYELQELLRLSEETIRFQKKMLNITSTLLEELNENIYSRLERLKPPPLNPLKGTDALKRSRERMKIIRIDNRN